MTKSDDPVGTLAEETAKLVGALSGWAREQGGDLADGVGAGLDAHLATGAPECTWCPLCRVVHVVRRLDPEVRQHLADAAASMAQAAAGLLAVATDPSSGARPGDTGGGGPGSTGVEHIDLDADEAADQEETE